MPAYYYLLFLFAAMSAVSFFLYGIDKWKARRGAWRIPERTLLLWGFLGGAAGALLAMQTFRHKTRHYYFYVVNVLGLALQLGAVAWLFLK